MRPSQNDLEARLRRYAEIFGGEVAADDRFERRILARLAGTNRVRPARRPLLRELALGALVVLFVAALGIGFAKLRADRSSAIAYVPSVVLAPGPIDLGSNFSVPGFHMVTADKGWAIGRPTGPAGASEAILRTDDGGRQWQNVTPPGSRSDARRTAAFLDADHAWVAVSPEVQGPPTTLTMTIYRTADRARTWQSAQVVIPDGTGAGQLHFVDTQHGWLIAATNNGDAIYRTADGGIHWTVASLMPFHAGGGPLDQAPDGSLPNNEPAPPADAGSQGPFCRLDPFFGLSFKNASTGWAFGNCMGVNATYFFVTHDGGKVWVPQPLTYPAGYPGPCQCWTNVTNPVFTSPRDGWFTVSLSTAITTCATTPQGGNGCSTNTTPKLIVLYSTRDGGNTWQPTMLPASSGRVAFADTGHGWFAGKTPQNLFDHLWMTADGGRTWTAINTEVPLGPVEFQFISPSTGWSVGIEASVVGHSILLQTIDGGHHWQRLKPTLTR
jgi:photosystem II stability/assembly factor-like uncharacterized protein